MFAFQRMNFFLLRNVKFQLYQQKKNLSQVIVLRFHQKCTYIHVPESGFFKTFYKTSFLLSTELELMLQTHTYMSSILISNFICEFRFHHHVWDTLHTLSTKFVCGSQIVGIVPLAPSPSQRTKGAHQPTISKRRSVYRHHFGVGRKEAVHQQVHSGIRVALLSKTS